jgi:predicted phage gp36 major capsid-like protein
LAGKLRLQSGQILFEDQKSLDLYNSYLARISALSEQEKEILNEQQQRIESAKRKMNEEL